MIVSVGPFEVTGRVEAGQESVARVCRVCDQGAVVLVQASGTPSRMSGSYPARVLDVVR